jgi:hypothetical protein
MKKFDFSTSPPTEDQYAEIVLVCEQVDTIEKLLKTKDIVQAVNRLVYENEQMRVKLREEIQK